MKKGHKALLVRKLIMRPEGASYDELCEATGWKRISVPDQAGIAKFSYVSVQPPRGKGRIRYYGIPAGAALTIFAPKRAEMKLTL